MPQKAKPAPRTQPGAPAPRPAIAPRVAPKIMQNHNLPMPGTGD